MSLRDPYSNRLHAPSSAELCKELPDMGSALARALARLAALPTRDGCAHMVSRLGRLEAYVKELRRALEREMPPRA